MKKFYHYIFELLAIFLGVSGSFYLENYRENQFREKEIVEALNLMHDSVSDDIEMLKRECNLSIRYAQALKNWMDENFVVPNHPDTIEFYYVSLAAFNDFQLNNSGYAVYIESVGKELIETPHLKRNIAKYYNDIFNSAQVQSETIRNWAIELDMILQDSNQGFFAENENNTKEERYNRFEKHRLFIQSSKIKGYIEGKISLLQLNARLIKRNLKTSEELLELINHELELH